MKNTFFIIAILANIQGFSQGNFEKQYQLVKSNLKSQSEILDAHTPSDFKTTLFIDYIVKKYSGNLNLSRFISNRYFLEPFIPLIINNREVKLVKNMDIPIEIDISIQEKSIGEIGTIQYDSTNKAGAKKNEFDFDYIKSINNKSVFGLAFDTAFVVNIKSISFIVGNETHVVESKYFDDLYFPNLCEVRYVIKPAQAYLSPDNRYVYLYLFGGQDASVFFTKLIFDIESKVIVGRMIANDNELRAYRCLSTLELIGF